MAVTCPNCKHDNADGILVCEYCGYVLDPAAVVRQIETQRFAEADRGKNQPRWGSASFDEQTHLILRVTETSQIIHVAVHKSPEGIILGRYDATTETSPEVDLSGFKAEENGVSRRHARLSIQDDSLYITDLDAPNATYLNGLRLTAHQPRILRDGDEIRLGKLRLQVTFVDTMSDK